MDIGAAPTSERAGEKRHAACMSPLDEKPAKNLHGEIDGSILELTISYISGDLLAKVKISSVSSVAELKQKTQERLDSGKVVQKLLKGGTLLQEAQSLAASGLVDGAEVKAIIGSKPMLFASAPNDEDSPLFSSDGEGEDGEDAAPRRDITEAPHVAREVAHAMIEAAPNLGDIPIVGSNESDDGGKIIVIAHPGDDPEKACLKALRVPKYMESVRDRISNLQGADESDPERSGAWRCATLDYCDWSKHLTCGFNNSLKDDEDHEDEESNPILALTKIMSEKLEKHFTFGFTDDVVRAPMVYGGYASDGNIVGVLTSRVWT